MVSVSTACRGNAQEGSLEVKCLVWDAIISQNSELQSNSAVQAPRPVLSPWHTPASSKKDSFKLSQTWCLRSHIKVLEMLLLTAWGHTKWPFPKIMCMMLPEWISSLTWQLSGQTRRTPVYWWERELTYITHSCSTTCETLSSCVISSSYTWAPQGKTCCPVMRMTRASPLNSTLDADSGDLTCALPHNHMNRGSCFSKAGALCAQGCNCLHTGIHMSLHWKGYLFFFLCY